MTEPLLTIEELVFEAAGRRILDRFTLSLEEGDIHALLGANGAGKSTLAYLLMGSESYVPAHGTIRFGGHDLLPLKMHERAALGLTMAWQEPARFEGITVREFLMLGHRDRDPVPALRAVGLDPDRYLNRPMDTFLSGENAIDSRWPQS